MPRFLIATRNRHKVEEIRLILGPAFTCLDLSEFPAAPTVKEDGASFAANASLKAVGLARWLSTQPTANGTPPSEELWVMADDSGLEVDALDGAPGVHSARFAAADRRGEANSPDDANNAKLLELLKDVPHSKRTARFRCLLALTPLTSEAESNASTVCYADESELRTELYDGVCEGRIISLARGAKGFGYDPLFVPDGYDQSFAELGDEVKNKISHRARALLKVRQRFGV